MAEYDLGVLNDKEFETLLNDLIEADRGVHVERFKTGKDGGIDGRMFHVRSAEETIIQAKHYIKSGLDGLCRSLKEREVDNLRTAKPERYILGTSIPLSPANKRRLSGIIDPILENPPEILGADDIHALLGKHPDVDRRHYKLWISSTNVLVTILNNDVTGRARGRLARLEEFQRLYTETEFHKQAIDHLNERNVLILTGDPGVGKTTLAEAVCLVHAADGYEVVFVEESVEEAERVYAADKPQIFYFDDFLGTNYLAALDRDSDAHIVHFMNRVARDPNKRVVLTSRTNIIQQAKRLTDQFRIHNVDRNEYELQLGILSELDKAKILYNHIWFTGLADDYVESYYKERRYRKVIKHRNYNPRLIEFVTDPEKLDNVSPDEYWDHICAALDNPSDVWGHAIDAQLDEAGRTLVLLVVFNGGSVRENVLERAYSALRTKGYARAQGNLRGDFRPNVRAVCRAFLTREWNKEANVVIYKPVSPSLSDFVLREFGGDATWLLEICSALGTRVVASTLSDLTRNAILAGAQYERLLGDAVDRILEGDEAPWAYVFRMWRLWVEDGNPADRRSSRIARSIESVPWIELDPYARLDALCVGAVLISNGVIKSPEKLAQDIVDQVDIQDLDLEDFEALVGLLKQAGVEAGTDMGSKVSDAISDEIVAQAPVLARETDGLQDFTEEDEEAGAREVLEQAIDEQTDLFRPYVRAGVETEIEIDVNLEEIMIENQERAMHDDHKVYGAEERMSTAAGPDSVDDLFDRAN